MTDLKELLRAYKILAMHGLDVAVADALGDASRLHRHAAKVYTGPAKRIQSCK